MKTTSGSLALISLLALTLVAPTLFAEPTATLIITPKAGAKAPLVEGKDQDGNKWKLSDEIGRNAVLLYFYPKDNTPGCTKEACSLRDKIGDFKTQGVDVVGVSFDSADSHKNFVFKYDLNFPLIADPEGKIADIYGVRMSGGKKMARRVSFLINMDGKIVHVTDSPNPDIHLKEMQRAIEGLKNRP
jgi:peroxiredoxin Q/BCP